MNFKLIGVDVEPFKDALSIFESNILKKMSDSEFKNFQRVINDITKSVELQNTLKDKFNFNNKKVGHLSHGAIDKNGNDSITVFYYIDNNLYNIIAIGKHESGKSAVYKLSFFNQTEGTYRQDIKLE